MKSLTLRSIPCPCWRWALQLLSLLIHASLIFAFSSIPHDTFHSTRTHGRFKDRSFPTLDHDRFPSKHRAVGLLHVTPNDSDSINNKEEINPVTKASWYAVEWFGKAFGQTTETKASYSGPPQSLTETLQRIQLDNERSYFLSGQVDESIYDPDCVFRDPFVSFAGRDRFVTNLANLGSFISKYDARVLEYNQPNETTIQTKIMVKLELNLPWKPVLAWPWGVTYTIDSETYCIVDHEESWDIEPWEGVKQIFRKPTFKL